jgi:hypothetical protein
MKLLTSTFFTLLLIGSAGSAYGQGFEETKRLSSQNYFGITPDKKYGLPNNIGAYQTNRLPETSSEDLTISANFLIIRTYINYDGQDISGFIDNDQYYSLVFSDGAITDRAGNSVEPKSYALNSD